MLDENMPTVPYISIIYREHAKYLNDKVKNDNLSFGLYPLLIRIYHNDGIIQEQLAQDFHLNESTIARNLKKLEEKGFIKRIPDKRAKRIRITDEGMKTARKLMDIDEEWDMKIRKIIGSNQYDNLRNMLKKITEEIT